MTNADRIRQMTDKELCDFIVNVRLEDIDFAKTYCVLCDASDGGCPECCIRWWLTQDSRTHPQGLDYWNDDYGQSADKGKEK